MTKYIKKLPSDARKIKNTMNWVDRNGNVYGIETRKFPNRFNKGIIGKHKHYGEFFQYSPCINNHNGYVYIPIKYIIDKKNNIYKNRQRRLNIIVAETFLENPNNYPIVGHRNNIKSDNRVDNLYWTTWKENTQKAVDDGLLVNDKSYDDSQSKAVIMFDTYTNKKIAEYGSASEAYKKTGISKSTILRQARYKKPVRKKFYFRFIDDETAQSPTIIIQYDMNTDKEINRFFNSMEAANSTGINYKTILDQCKKGEKPKWSKSNTYFLYK